MVAGKDFRLSELLCSHLCHEIISPLTAVSNGLELLDRDALGDLGEAVDLTRESAEVASRRIQFYRLAYGQAAGFDPAGGLATARELAAGLFAAGRIDLDWPAGHPDPAPAITKPSVKLLLNMVALGGEALPRGGVLAVRIVGGPGGPRAEVTATGPRASFRAEVRTAMEAGAEVAALEPRTVQAYLTARLAEALGAGLALDQDEADSVRLSAPLVTAS